MYQHPITKKLVMDAVDYFIFSYILGYYSATYLKKYNSEESKMQRLRDDIIKQSRPVRSNRSKSKKVKVVKKKSSTIRRTRMPSYTSSLRGGQRDIPFKLAEEIKALVSSLAVFLKSRELKANQLRFIFTFFIYALRTLLAQHGISFTYLLINNSNPVLVYLSLVSGTTTGFIFSWFSIGSVLFAPPTIMAFFLARSTLQQTLAFKQYVQWKLLKERLRTNKEFQKNVEHFISETNALQDSMEESRSINADELHWNTNPALQKEAGKLKIFEDFDNKELEFNTLGSNEEINKLRQDLGLSEKPKTFIKRSSKPRMRRQAKTQNFRDFIRENPEIISEAENGINIKPEVPAKIRIENGD